MPRSFLSDDLTAKAVPTPVRRGATVNPFNFIAAERDLNSKRSSFPFDFQDDKVRRPYRIPLNPEAYRSTGLDHENEWVVPPHSRGDIARAILYMVLTYQIRELDNVHLDQLRHRAKIDPAALWALDFNVWVAAKHGISNPLIAPPAQAPRWLDDDALMDSARLTG